MGYSKGSNRGPARKNRVNREITGVRLCILIDESGAMLGKFDIRDARRIAQDKGLDLVEMNHDDVPTCRLMDYGKFCYEQNKRDKERKRSQAQASSLKQMKYRPKIGDGDYAHKTSKVRQFLEGGDKVRIVVMFRGREITHTDIGKQILDRVAEDLSDVAQVVNAPRIEGRDMSMLLAPLPEDKRRPKQQDA